MKNTHIHTHLLSCSEIYTHLCENLDAKIDSEECRRIKAHIAECENCTALLDSLKKTVYLYRKYPTPKVPAAARTDLFAVIRLEQKKGKKRPSR